MPSLSICKSETGILLIFLLQNLADLKSVKFLCTGAWQLNPCSLKKVGNKIMQDYSFHVNSM